MRKLRLLVVGHLPPPYFGPSVTYSALMHSAFPERFEVAFIDQTVIKKVGELERLHPRKLLLLARMVCQMFGRLIRRRYDYLFLSVSCNRNAFLKEWLLIRVAGLFGVPAVLYAHANGFLDFYKKSSPGMQRRIEKTVRNSAGAIVMGEGQRFNFDQWLPADRIFVVASGIEAPPLPQRSAPAGGPFTGLFLGNLIREKGVFVLLEAAARVVKAYPDARFIFAGDWPLPSDRIEAEQKIREWGIDKNVSFAGVVWGERKWQLLVDADALVFPSYYYMEVHPLVVVEAMWAGLPVISTKWAAIPEMVKDGVNGLLATPRDAGDLAEKILRIIRDSSLREGMRQANRRRFDEFFTQDRYGERIIRVFETLALADGKRCVAGGTTLKSGK
ncbi:MAG TPA: glycosyltransferase family 4 protein [Verrucomicrobiae bacterium]|nr:glycosyltransferase family 4 protein [Verrucomicrobiae bacterium]